MRWDRLDEAIGRVEAQRWGAGDKERVSRALEALKSLPPGCQLDIEWAKAQGDALPRAPRPWPCADVASLTHFPDSWLSGTRTSLVESDPASVEREWALTRELVALRSKLIALCAGMGDPVDPKAEAFSALPKAIQLRRLEGARVVESGPEHSARAAEGYAIWMGAPQKLGYLGRTAQPIGTAGARLFETLGIARDFAKKHHFGAPVPGAPQSAFNGPIAIVRLLIAPTALEPGSADAPEVSLAIARAQAQEIQDAMELGLAELFLAQQDAEAQARAAATVAALGGAVSPPSAPLAKTPPKGKEKPAKAKPPAARRGRAWAQDAYALWLDFREGESGMRAGFAGRRTACQPLAAAQLFRSAKQALLFHQSATADRAVVRVRARPVAIEEVLGDLDIVALQNAIAQERALLAEEAENRERIRRAREERERMQSAEPASGSEEPVKSGRGSRRL